MSRPINVLGLRVCEEREQDYGLADIIRSARREGEGIVRVVDC